MRKEPLLYLLIGLLLGLIVSGFLVWYSIAGTYGGMMHGGGIFKNSDNVDRHFIEQMVPHHEDAIAMAKLALHKSRHNEVKTLANNIIASQTAEINTMKQWYKDWYGADVPAVSMRGMHGDGMMHAQTNLDELNTATDFDEAFLSQMIPHHQMAVMMANMLSISTNRPEMKKLATDIMTAQDKEIGDMQLWQQRWGYATPAGGVNR